MIKPLDLISLLLALSACGAPPVPSAAPPSSSPLPASGALGLATDPPAEYPSGGVAVCAGIALSAILHGDATDPHIAWLIADPGKRVEVTWPPGYRARFTPDLEVLDEQGVVVLKEGDGVWAACVTGDRVLHLEPPFR